MSNENQETIADIVAAMRDESHAGDASCLEWVGAKIRHYADRIEAAAKREREAGAEAAQEMREMANKLPDDYSFVDIVSSDGDKQLFSMGCLSSMLRKAADAIEKKP